MANLSWRGEEIKRKLTTGLGTALDLIAGDMVTTISDSMRAPKSGVPVPTGFKLYSMKRKSKYPRGRIKGWGTRRSAPGEAPAVQTGRLRTSVKAERIAPLVRRVGTPVKYGKWLEEGIKGGTVIRPRHKRALAFIVPSGEQIVRRSVVQGAIAPRPWLAPAIKAIRPQAERRIARAVRF